METEMEFDRDREESMVIPFIDESIIIPPKPPGCGKANLCACLIGLLVICNGFLEISIGYGLKYHITKLAEKEVGLGNKEIHDDILGRAKTVITENTIKGAVSLTVGAFLFIGIIAKSNCLLKFWVKLLVFCIIFSFWEQTVSLNLLPHDYVTSITICITEVLTDTMNLYFAFCIDIRIEAITGQPGIVRL